MRKILHAESTLTDRYQTTIPESIRDALHLDKRDKITYDIDEKGKVLLSRADKEDPIFRAFLLFIVNDIKKNPSHIKTIPPALAERAKSLTLGIEVDLDIPLSDEDE